jgi:hypothetical protein
MANLVEVRRLFDDEGDGAGEVWRYVVQFDAYDYTIRQARAAAGIPADGSVLAGTNWVSKASAKRNADNPCLCMVDVRFSAPNARNETKPVGTSVRWNVAIDCKPQEYSRPVHNDRTGASIVNSAGYPFSEQPTITDGDNLWTISFNTDDGDVIEDIKASYQRTNSDPISFSFKGVTISIPAGHARLVDYSWGFDHDYASDGSDETFKVSLTILEREDEWHDLSIANTGFYNADGEPFLDENGEPRVEPTTLNTSGYELAQGSEAVPLTFDVKTPIAFAPLVAGL